MKAATTEILTFNFLILVSYNTMYRAYIGMIHIINSWNLMCSCEVYRL